MSFIETNPQTALPAAELSEQTQATIGGVSYSFSKDGIRQMVSLETGKFDQVQDEDVERINEIILSYSSQNPDVAAAAAPDLTNCTYVKLEDFSGKFALNDEFLVITNPDHPEQSIYVPNESIYMVGDAMFIKAGTEINVPLACIQYPDGGCTNFDNAPAIVTQDERVYSVA